MGILLGVRIAIVTSIFLTGLILLLTLVHQLVLPLVAEVVTSLEPPFYDIGVYGTFRPETYASFDLSSPRASLLQYDERCDNGLVFLTPNGESVPDPGPMIVDSRGRLVWMSDEFGVSTNLKVQRYQGQDYLTFWAGQKEGSKGHGAYYMLDSSYEIAHVIDAAGTNVHGDLHEFIITENGTALFTVYNATSIDLRSMGWGRSEQGWIYDSIFQEIDIATGELLFEWRASEHFRANDSYMWDPFAGYSESVPFDFFHINSVEKDSQGNYLVSSRHMHTLSYISAGGETLWILGGRYNEFTDLSDGKATNFKWQHDARWISLEDGILSLFDNQDAGLLHIEASYSQGLVIQLDVANRTATLLHSYDSLQQTRAPSQGSVQLLPESDNQVFIGWGHSAAYSEYTTDGELLCESHFGASALNFLGRVTSYRAFKSTGWVGTPAYPPAAMVQGDEIYVSWNGATEVSFWELQGGYDREGGETDFIEIDVVEKDGFETSFTLPSKTPSETNHQRYRVAALSKRGEVLQYSDVVEDDRAREGQSSSGLFYALATLSAFVGSWCLWVLWHRKGAWVGGIQYKYQKL